MTLSHITPELRDDPARFAFPPNARLTDDLTQSHEQLIHDEDGTVLGAVFAEPWRVVGPQEEIQLTREENDRAIAFLEENFTPELHFQTVERDGWTVKLTREGSRFEYALLSRWEGRRVLVSIDPQLDEEANVFLDGDGGKLNFICLALLISIQDSDDEPAVIKRAPGHIHDWEVIGEHYPDGPIDCYVRDAHGRLGAATRVGGQWRVYAGNADASALTHWAWMEPEA